MMYLSIQVAVLYDITIISVVTVPVLILLVMEVIDGWIGDLMRNLRVCTKEGGNV